MSTSVFPTWIEVLVSCTNRTRCAVATRTSTIAVQVDTIGTNESSSARSVVLRQMIEYTNTAMNEPITVWVVRRRMKLTTSRGPKLSATSDRTTIVSDTTRPTTVIVAPESVARIVVLSSPDMRSIAGIDSRCGWTRWSTQRVSAASTRIRSEKRKGVRQKTVPSSASRSRGRRKREATAAD